MDSIQLLANEYHQGILASVDAYARSIRPFLTNDEFDKAMHKHISDWKVRLSDISNDTLVDPIKKEIVDINLSIVNSWLYTLNKRMN
jgi:hypothetical protein